MYYATAFKDIVKSFSRLSLVNMLGWQDVKKRYRRSFLGPFWVTISMGTLIASIGTVFGLILGSPMEVFLPFLSIGMIIWNLIVAVCTEGCNSFIEAEGIIKQLPVPLFCHVLRTIWRNFLIFSHNLLIIPVLFLIFGKGVGWIALAAIPGVILLLLNLTWLCLIFSIYSSRYRDFSLMLANLLQIIYFITPILWLPKSLPKEFSDYLIIYNPFYHLLDVIRSPLLGDAPAMLSWLVVSGLSLFGWTIAIFLFGKYRHRIVYWL